MAEQAAADSFAVYGWPEFYLKAIGIIENLPSSLYTLNNLMVQRVYTIVLPLRFMAWPKSRSCFGLRLFGLFLF